MLFTMLPVIHIPNYASEVIRELERMGFSAYVVGGCVRDSLLGQKPADWDVCTDAIFSVNGTCLKPD